MNNKDNIFFIAEAGINHNGELDNAFKLIEIAKSANCDSIKFQKRDIDICIPLHQRQAERETPWGKMSYYDYKKRIEFGKKEYSAINSYCKELGISWSASAWDLNSLKFLENFEKYYFLLYTKSLL
jgi:N-acetylneuraminate synthase